MTYAVPADIRDAVAPDGNTTGTCGDLEDDQLQGAIQRAQDVVNGIVGTVYPDDDPPSLLTGLVIALGAYYATLSYRKSKDLTPEDPVVLMYTDARQTLTDIKNGLVEINPVDSTEPGPTFSRRRPKVLNPNGSVSVFTIEDTSLGVRQSARTGPRFEPGWSDDL